MRRIVVTALALVTLASCGGVMERSPDVLAQALASDPPTLNPVLATDVTSGEINRYVFESLLERDNATLELTPKLAKSWEVSADHLNYTFELRRDVRWHDGAPFTADDVVYTFERIRDPKVDAASLRNYFKDVARIEKLGDYTVRIVYTEPYFKALEIIGGATIIPKHVFDDGTDFNKNPASRRPIGTGPYRFAGWATGQVVRLKRNEDYWGEKPEISGMVFQVIPDQAVRFQLLKKAAIDVEGLRAIQWVRQTEGKRFKDNFTKHRYWLPNYSYIGWNTKNPMFEDRRVRLAMTMLTNRREILDKILLGQGEVVSSGFYKFGPQYDASIEEIPFDPVRAKQLLTEAGWVDHDGDGIIDKDGLPFRFTLLAASGSNLAKSIGLIMREDLLKVGIEMNIRQLEWATMLKLLSERSFEATLLGWSMPLTQDPYQLWHSSQIEKGSNMVGFSDPKADRLIERARREFDPEVRRGMYKEFQRIVHEAQPYTFLFINPSLVAVARRFEDVRDYRLGLDPLEWTVGPWPKLIQW